MTNNDIDVRFSLLELDLPAANPKPAEEPETPTTEEAPKDTTEAELVAQVQRLREDNPVAPKATSVPLTMTQAAVVAEAIAAVGHFATVRKTVNVVSGMIRSMASLAPRATTPNTIDSTLANIATESRQARRQRRSGSLQRRSQTTQELRRAQRRDEIVLSLANDNTALGIVVGWEGRGELTVQQCAILLEASNLPDDLVPRGLSTKAALGKAIGLLRSRGYSCNWERKPKTSPTDTRAYISRYTVGDVDHSTDLGESLGSKIATATLYKDGTLELQGPEGLCALVRAEYRRVTQDHVLTAGKVTQWIQSVLTSEFDAVAFGPSYLIPAPFQAAEEFTTNVSKYFGCSWYDKAPRLTTAESIGANVAGGLTREIEAISNQMSAAEALAATKQDKDGNAQSIRESTAAGYLSKLQEVADRARVYSGVLDPEGMERVATAAAALIARCQTHTSAGATRAAIFWAEELTNSTPSDSPTQDDYAARWAERTN